MEEDIENYNHLARNLEYNEDLNNIFKTLSGYYFDREQGRIVKAKGFKRIMSDYAINLYMDRTIKAMTNITRLSNNEGKIIAYKSIRAKTDLWILTHSLLYEDATVRALANSKLGVLVSIINGLTMVIDDSYRQSTNMKTANLIYKQYQVSENIQHTKDKSKNLIGGLIPRQRNEEDE